MITAFDELLAVNQVANFAWWNEDHNYYIDLRASIPLRRAALALGAACDADTYDDGLFLFYPEALDVAFGRQRWKDLQSLATARTSTTTTTTRSATACPRWSARSPTRSRIRC